MRNCHARHTRASRANVSAHTDGRRALSWANASRATRESAHRTSPNILFFVMSLNFTLAEASVTMFAGARETHALLSPGLAGGKHQIRTTPASSCALTCREKSLLASS